MVKKSSLYIPNRYTQGGITESDNIFLGWWERNIYQSSYDDYVITISSKYHMRPDLLSYDLYGKVGYQWLILQYNNILDIAEEFVIGAKIKAPSQTRLQSLLAFANSNNISV